MPYRNVSPAELGRTPGAMYVPVGIGDGGAWTRVVKSDLVASLEQEGVTSVPISESHEDWLVHTSEAIRR